MGRRWVLKFVPGRGREIKKEEKRRESGPDKKTSIDTGQCSPCSKNRKVEG